MRVTTDEAALPMFPSIAVGSSGVVVAWEDSRDGNWEVYCRYYREGSWSSEIRVTNTPGITRYPDVAVSGGFMVLTWADQWAGGYSIYFVDGVLREGLDMVYALFRWNTRMVCGRWERDEGSQVIEAATSDTAGAGLVGLGLGYYLIWDCMVVFDDETADPVTLEWVDTTHNLIVFGGPFVNSVSKKLESELGVSLIVNPDGTWTLHTPLGDFDYGGEAYIGKEDLIYIALVKDHERYILFIMGLTPYGTTAGSQFVRRFLNPWTENMEAMIGATKAVVKWEASTPNTVTPSDTWTVLAAG